MKFKAALALATLASSMSSFAQTEIHVQDLNFIPKEKQFVYNGSLDASSGETTREVKDPGSVTEQKTKDSAISSTHMLAYGLSDTFTIFSEISYDFKSENKIDSYEVNGSSQSVSGTTKDKGLNYLAVGGNWRFIDQNTNSINGDLRFSYSQGLQDPERGSIYDSNGDGNDDSGSEGNTAQIAPEVAVGVFLGKKLEQFEVRGGLNLHYTTSGDYTLIKGESSTKDLKINQDGYLVIEYLLQGQLKLNEQLYLYGQFGIAAISDVKSDYKESNGDKGQSEGRAVTVSSLTLGGKVVLVPNKFYLYGEFSATSMAEQTIVTKTNGTKDHSSDKITDATTTRVAIGLAANF